MNNHTNPLVSIIINNYNYETFLAKAIDSALQQSYPNIEVVIVDDGSTDNSRKIIESYGNQIIPVFKENGGQASSLNSGFQASSGDILCFLDADDTFCHQKIETVIQVLAQIGWQHQNVLLNNFLEVIDGNEIPVQVDLVNEILSGPGEWRFLPLLASKSLFFDGQINQISTPEQVQEFATKYRFIPYLGVQTSGITITRSLADKVFPLPEQGIKISADVFLVKAASLQGSVYSTHHPLTRYRVHGSNHWYARKNSEEFSDVETFFSELNRFLNSKLGGLSHEPVFSYLDSMSAKGYYRYYFGFQSHQQLLNLAFKVLRWHIDRTTIIFFIKTTLLALYFRYKCSVSSSSA
jgi:glycosyltransferase involved in cell wall biosynthesis